MEDAKFTLQISKVVTENNEHPAANECVLKNKGFRNRLF